MALKGGYQMIDLQGTAFTLGNAQTISGIYEKLEGGYAKPILLTGLNIRNVEKRDAWCNFSVDGTTFVASFDDYTVAITDDDEVTFTARSYYLDDIVDSEGNQRFIEGEGTVATITNYTPVYNKWSLSGSHLLIVVSGTFANAAEPAADTILFTLDDLPDYIKDKIVPIAGNRIDVKTVKAYADTGSSQDLSIICRKESNVYVQLYGGLTLTAERTFRYQLDLLIDTDEE